MLSVIIPDTSAIFIMFFSHHVSSHHVSSHHVSSPCHRDVRYMMCITAFPFRFFPCFIFLLGCLLIIIAQSGVIADKFLAQRVGAVIARTAVHWSTWNGDGFSQTNVPGRTRIFISRIGEIRAGDLATQALLASNLWCLGPQIGRCAVAAFDDTIDDRKPPKDRETNCHYFAVYFYILNLSEFTFVTF